MRNGASLASITLPHEQYAGLVSSFLHRNYEGYRLKVDERLVETLTLIEDTMVVALEFQFILFHCL